MKTGILFVGNFLSGRGLHRHYCEDLADRIEGRGWNVIRVSDRSHRVARLSDMLATAWTRRHDYALAHVDVFSGTAFLWAEALCLELQALRKPFVVTLRGGNLPAFSRRWPRRVKRALSSARFVTSPTSFLRHELENVAPQVEIVPNALESAAYPFRRRTDPSLRLVWLRAFHHTYNPLLAVEVLARLPESATLVMAGPDKGDGARPAVERRIRELDLESRVELRGTIDKRDVARYLDQGDIFLNTTNADNSPVSVLEALACGLCVVSTDAGGLRYLLADGETAVLVPVRDPDAMASAVMNVHRDRSLASRLSTGGRALAVESDWQRVLDRWEQLFGEASGRA